MQEVSADIIKSCQNGNLQAFAEVMKVYEKPIFSYAYRFLYNKSGYINHEDAAQEIFLKVYQNINKFIPDENRKFSTWLFSIAHNFCISILRQNKKTFLSLDSIEDDDKQIMDTSKPDADEIAWQNEMGKKIADAVSMLPIEQKSAFILRYYEDLSYEEIANILQSNIGTIKTRVARVKEILRENLKDCF